MSKKNNITVSKTAVYYSLGDVKTAKTIWFVLHGYGYLAKDFIQKFEPILTEDVAVIAPEGLSKFYLNGVEGRIGASWMTKEDREEEIGDYVNYLNQLYTNIIKSNTNTDVKINVVGFSQGGATGSRWLANGEIKCDNFILWASVFPDDMDFKSITHVDTFFLYGDDDKYVTPERVAKQKAAFDESGISIKTTLFEGKHDIPPSVLVEQTAANNW